MITGLAVVAALGGLLFARYLVLTRELRALRRAEHAQDIAIRTLEHEAKYATHYIKTLERVVIDLREEPARHDDETRPLH
jgi:hypothetical protein